MPKKTAEIEPIGAAERRAEQLPANVQALMAKFDRELADPSLAPARRKFLESRREIHAELHDVFRRLA